MTKARDIATSEVVTGEIGSTIQAHDDDLDSIAALDKTDGNVIVGDGANWVSESGATARTSLGLGSAATTDSTDYATAAQGALASTALQPTGDGSQLTGIAVGGGFSNMEVFTSSGTWTNPGNIEKVKVTVIGGGGYGGSTNSPTNSRGVSSGGGGGGGAIEVIPFPSGTNVPVTVGPGGTGSGGTSSFGAYCSASGGAAGFAITQNLYSLNVNHVWDGAAGGVGSGGGINLYGERSHERSSDSIAFNNPGLFYTSGEGGGSALGFGWGGPVSAKSRDSGSPRPGTAGNGYGAGGGGAVKQSPGGNNTIGGGGTAGVVIVEY